MLLKVMEKVYLIDKELKMTKKYVFIDVDGTLVTYKNELPDSAIAAIKKARNNGHKIYLVTGRSKAEMPGEITNIGYDGYSGGNGSYVEVNEEVIFERTLSFEDCSKIVNWLDNRGLEYYLECNSGLFASDHFKEECQEPIQKYTNQKIEGKLKNITTSDVFTDMIYGENTVRSDVNKISFILKSYQDYIDAKNYFTEFKVSTWGGAGEKALFGDVALSNIDKSYAVKEIISYEGASLTDTIAIGDATVDIPMLEICEVGISMGNGGKQIKEVADYITTDVDKNGLYEAFQNFSLI